MGITSDELSGRFWAYVGLLLTLLANGVACSHQRSSAPAARHHGKDEAPPAPTFQDAGQVPDPFAFRPADAATTNPAFDDQTQFVPELDAGSEPSGDCIELEPGDTRMVDSVLTDEWLWMRIDPQAGCPATHVTDREVAYAPFVLCASALERSVTITMLGADMLPASAGDAVADQMLAVYADEQALSADPFDCLAVNDDAVFDGFLSNSARIDRLRIETAVSVAVIATSAERPDQHGVGAFSLMLTAE